MPRLKLDHILLKFPEKSYSSLIMIISILAIFMEVTECDKYGYNNTTLTAENKASNMAMSGSLFINVHKLRSPVNSRLGHR